MMRDVKSTPVDQYLDTLKTWKNETTALRALCLEQGLDESIKWGKPCYDRQGANIVLIQGFKAYIALLFFKGALLKDSEGQMVSPGQHTQAGRQLRFTSLEQINASTESISAALREAVDLEIAGLKVPKRATEEVPVSPELESRMKELPELRAAFQALTPGRQRAYLLYFSGAKQTVTRLNRVDKSIPRILDGKGLHDH